MIAADLIKSCIIDVFKDTVKGEIRSTVKGGTSKACHLLKNMIKNNILYTIDFSSNSYNTDMYAILEDPVLLRLNLPKTLDIEYIGEEVIRHNSIAIPEGEELYKLFYWNGIPIIIQLSNEHSKNNINGNITEFIGIKFYTINTSTNRNKLCQFAIKLLKRIENSDYNNKMSRKTYTSCYKINEYGRTKRFDTKLRTFDDVFLTDEHQELLISTLDNFKDKRSWYKEKNIPYHLGILLYSEGGTGKTSIAQAICDHMKATPTFINGNTLIHLPKYLDRLKQHVSNPLDYRAIIIEDIDCSSLSQSRQFATGEASREDMKMIRHNGQNGQQPTVEVNMGLSDILNCLDGVSAPDNMIFIFTTNHIEKLDPALIRPGRIDVRIDVPCVTPCTLNKFLKKMYDYEIPTQKLKNLKIRKHLKFAELQLEVVRGRTPEEIIKFAETEIETPVADPEDVKTEEINETKKNNKK